MSSLITKRIQIKPFQSDTSTPLSSIPLLPPLQSTLPSTTHIPPLMRILPPSPSPPLPLHHYPITHEVPPFVKLFHILPNTPPVAFCSLHAAFLSAALASCDVRLYCVRPAYWPAEDYIIISCVSKGSCKTQQIRRKTRHTRLLPAAAAEMAPGTTSVDLRGVASAFGGGEADLFSACWPPLPPWEDWEPERGL
jgi:hypothetical protein